MKHNFSRNSYLISDKPNVLQKKGNIYVKSSVRNVFCTLLDVDTKKVKTSCSLRIVSYKNEHNERESLFKRGILLGELFGDKIIALGYKKVSLYLRSGINIGQKGLIRGLLKKQITVSFVQITKGYSHNGCRPRKIRRKKNRTRPSRI